MKTSRSNIMKSIFLAATMLATGSAAWAGQAPGALFAADIPISHHDRVYAAEQFSNTVSVTDPVDNKLLGVIRLGDPQPATMSPPPPLPAADLRAACTHASRLCRPGASAWCTDSPRRPRRSDRLLLRS